MQPGARCTMAHYKRGVLGTTQPEKGFRNGHNSEKGISGRVRTIIGGGGGVLWYIIVLDTYVSAPPPPPAGTDPACATKQKHKII